MSLTKLTEFVKDIDIFISQHSIYINKLEKALKEGTRFEHKDCHSCNFGRKWDECVAPIKDQLPEDIKAIVENIEEIHCEFHKISMQIDPTQKKDSDEQNLKAMKDLSAKLFQHLLSLRQILVKQEA
ncbi:CZB domain-containing protein [Hydrogenobacter hydrogenophilus]|uniref:Chemoreceptor zinc-binding domain-containing protein n=1 Tax=Hydrogenobacter hydrogenophilus TaxID=35835 RepID=A0A285P561_9AQUI|nr:CZB domain-containing protein [Hydrogenobacter hydrogenophilus]SNZ16850.1 Chemoreceptor zinc-binding domain-containing protein [Hydrogenobacter hydrogenophilus]